LSTGLGSTKLISYKPSILKLHSSEEYIINKLHIQGVSRAIVNILGGGSMDYSE
jgi:hypothetical protein